MPGYPWLAEDELDGSDIQEKMKVLRTLGHPYTDEQIESAPSELENKTELDAVVAYLQSLGTTIKKRR